MKIEAEQSLASAVEYACNTLNLVIRVGIFEGGNIIVAVGQKSVFDKAVYLRHFFIGILYGDIPRQRTAAENYKTAAKHGYCNDRNYSGRFRFYLAVFNILYKTTAPPY